MRLFQKKATLQELELAQARIDQHAKDIEELQDALAVMRGRQSGFASDAADLQEQIAKWEFALVNHKHNITDPIEPPVGIWDRKTPQPEWPTKIAGIRVGYVRVGVPKAPLYVSTKDGMLVYESDDLRGGTNTDAKRIIAKSPNWFAVVFAGDVFGYGDPRPFGQYLDGDGLYYKVIHEQNIDGFVLSELGLPELYIRYQDVVDRFVPGA